MKILITEIAGFIGFHLARSLLKLGFDIVGIDNLNHYYDVGLKELRLKNLEKFNFKFYKIDITNKKAISNVFLNNKFDLVINLAAQAGVRYSFTNPSSYISNNILGFLNILEACKTSNIKNIIFASSSSVYGQNENEYFSELDRVDKPLNLYAVSKLTNELMAYSYANLYNIRSIGLRFFTVYGPWGRPDMAYFKFTNNILKGKPIEVYGRGEMYRDFTYIDDIISGIIIIVKDFENFFKNNRTDEIGKNSDICKLFNLGNNKKIKLKEFIKVIEEACGKKAIINYVDKQQGEASETQADLNEINSYINFEPKIAVQQGIPKFVNWFRKHYV